MISIVICSVNPGDLADVTANISKTIGIPHEIIGINNSINPRGICEVYNEGAARARFGTICFMHEDVEIRTENWGQVVLDIFARDQEIGIVGVAGGGYKSLAPEGWYQFEFHSLERSYQNVLQGYKYDTRNELHAYHNPRNEQLSRVVCVDGLWFCTKKEIALKYPFDQNLLKGFHGYDIDFCLQVFPHHKVMVTFDILMKHASEGNFNKFWFDEILKLHRKWSEKLPVTTSIMRGPEMKNIEKRAIKKVIGQMLRWEYSSWEILKMLYYASKSQSLGSKIASKGLAHLLGIRLQLLRIPDEQRI